MTWISAYGAQRACKRPTYIKTERVILRYKSHAEKYISPRSAHDNQRRVKIVKMALKKGDSLQHTK
jgi:hypothetical protein